MLRLKNFVLLVLLILGACIQAPVTPKPKPLEFDSDLRILRGTWTGASGDGHKLVLELTAESPSEDGYEITGTFQLDARAAVTMTGYVSVPVSSAALSTQTGTQTSPGCAVLARSAVTDDLWELCSRGSPGGSPPRLELDLYRYGENGTGDEAYTFSLTRVEDTGLLVQGHIVYAQGEPFTNPAAFEFTGDSHAVVQLYYSISALGDSPAEHITETRLENVSGFPLAYRLGGDPKTVFARPGDYFLQVEVFSGAGDETVVGDLISEFYTPVPRPGADVEVTVTGLEACNSPGAGGFCL